jgi:hypothetical protein
MSEAVVAADTRPTRASTPDSTPKMWVLVLALGFVLAARFLLAAWLPHRPGDFDLLYGAAGRVLRGESAYPGESLWSPYPLPAVLLFIPFTARPLAIARAIFDVLVGWSFAYALWRHRGPSSLLALVSGAYLFALAHGQATPLMVAASLIPVLGFLLAVRPNTSVSLVAAKPSRISIYGLVGFLGLTLVLFPSWPAEWWLTMPVNVSAWAPPMFRPLGALLLLAALRWNVPEGRLLLATALLPQTVLPYELVPLALIPGNRREMAIYLVGSWISVAAASGLIHLPGGPEWMGNGWLVTLCAGYLPMLYLVLKRPGSKGGVWIGRERRRPDRIPDTDLDVIVKVDDAGRVTVTVTHLKSQHSATRTAPTRERAERLAHDQLAAVLSKASRLAKKYPSEPK